MKGGYCRGVKGGYCRGGRVQDRKVMAYYGLLEEGREYRGERVIKVGVWGVSYTQGYIQGFRFGRLLYICNRNYVIAKRDLVRHHFAWKQCLTVIYTPYPQSPGPTDQGPVSYTNPYSLSRITQCLMDTSQPRPIEV